MDKLHLNRSSLRPKSSTVVHRWLLNRLTDFKNNSFPDPCPLGWTQFHDYCYSVSASSTSWSQAQVYCHFLSGELVKINSADENEFVLSLVRQQAPSVKQVWLGLQWDSTAFYWADHSVPVYKNWAPGEPNGKAKEPCAQMYTNRETQLPVRASGYWNDIPCGVDYLHPIGTVCKRLP